MNRINQKKVVYVREPVCAKLGEAYHVFSDCVKVQQINAIVKKIHNLPPGCNIVIVIFDKLITLDPFNYNTGGIRTWTQSEEDLNDNALLDNINHII